MVILLDVLSTVSSSRKQEHLDTQSSIIHVSDFLGTTQGIAGRPRIVGLGFFLSLLAWVLFQGLLICIAGRTSFLECRSDIKMIKMPKMGIKELTRRVPTWFFEKHFCLHPPYVSVEFTKNWILGDSKNSSMEGLLWGILPRPNHEARPRYISGLHGVVVTSEFYGSMPRLLGPRGRGALSAVKCGFSGHLSFSFSRKRCERVLLKNGSILDHQPLTTARWCY